MAKRPPSLDLWIPLEVIQELVPYAHSRGVSSVALGPGGFLEVYASTGGDPDEMADLIVPGSRDWTWAEKRDGFCKRHYRQMIKFKRKFWERINGVIVPTRQHTALIVWAYTPFYAELLKRMNQA